MSTKHFFPNTEGVVLLGLESLVARNEHLGLDTANKVVYSRTHRPSTVAIISGGGSGHEPAWSGYVGDGMLAASVSGEVFASPATRQVMAAIRRVGSAEAGVILCIGVVAHGPKREGHVLLEGRNAHPNTEIDGCLVVRREFGLL